MNDSHEAEPMKIHKNLVIRWLESHPEDFASIVPDHGGHTVEQYLAELKAASGQWFVGGVLEGTQKGDNK